MHQNLYPKVGVSLIALWLIFSSPQLMASTLLENKFPSSRISLSFSQVPLKDLFKLLGEIGNINLIGVDKLNGMTSIELVDVPWNEAFEMLLHSHQLGYKQYGMIVWVAPIELLRSFEKNHSSHASSVKFEKQVLIEARIVEADYRFARNLGVKFGITQRTDQNNNPLKNPSFNYESDLKAEGLNGFPASSSSITMFSKGASQLLHFELSALESDGKGNIIANPRIVTANQVKAVIEQGTELPYQTSTKEGSKVQFRKANLKLEVTPTIREGQIQMEVEISKDTIGMKTEQGFAIDTKHLRSQIIVEDGGTVVIGGIFLQTEREDIVQVPLLGRLPILGNLFKHRAKIKDKTELLVFLTPSLINHAGQQIIEKFSANP